jgi:NADPH-dependent dioxygenase
MTHSEVEVLVVGAGPVGLMAASQLARSGVSVRLVDAAAGPATTSRALGVHARSLEIYDQLGVVGDLVAHGTRVNAFIRHQGESTSRTDFDFGNLTSQFSYMFDIDQVIIERVLRGHAAFVGIEVEWNTKLDSFEQDDDGVTAQLYSVDGREETVRAQYLWGCDGGHSTVRKTLGLPLEGEAAHTWLIADAIIHTDIDRDGVHWLFAEDSTLMLFPFPELNKWRLLDTSGEGGVENPEQIAQQFSSKVSQALGRETVVETPSWTSKFTIQQRAVPAMHVRRCFVSGDAAHVHSPASGQGLNTGIQDAYNLAWKLAMVVHGQADATMLDTYDAERVPIGQALLASTKRVMDTAMVGTTPEDASDTDLAFMRQLIRSMSGLPIAYPDSPLTVPDDQSGGQRTVGPRSGQRLTQISTADAQSPGWTILRARLRHPGWHLLTFDGYPVSSSGDRVPADTAPLPAWINRVTISQSRPENNDHCVWDADGRVHDTLGVTDGDWILVRPDGLLSARGTGNTSLRDALVRLPGLHQ